MTSWVGNALEDVVSDNGPPQARLGNADYQWGQFDPEAYFQHYYGEPHPDDERVIRCAVAAMKQAPPVDAELDVVDVGTGPSLIPFLCALPRARQPYSLGICGRQYCLAGIGTTAAKRCARNGVTSGTSPARHICRNIVFPTIRCPSCARKALSDEAQSSTSQNAHGMRRRCSSVRNPLPSGQTNSKPHAPPMRAV